MAKLGPVGSETGGFEFDEVAPAGMEIGALLIRHGGVRPGGVPRNVIAAFQVIWRTPSGALQLGEPHGSFEVPESHQEVIALGAGEFIIEISGAFDGEFVHRLQVTTSSGTIYGPFGGQADGDYEFPTSGGPRQEIFGFHGRAGQLIDALGVHTRNR